LLKKKKKVPQGPPPPPQNGSKQDLIQLWLLNGWAEQPQPKQPVKQAAEQVVS